MTLGCKEATLSRHACMLQTGRGPGCGQDGRLVGRVWVQDLLVVGVRVGAGAWLAVLGGPDGGVAVETGGTLLTQLALGVVQAALHQSKTKTLRH